MADAPDHHRLRVRRRLLVLGLLPLLLALALCLKVGVMLGFDERGRSAFAEGRFEDAGDAFGVNERLNLFEPWVSRFDEGTADYALADFASARTLLESALLVVPDHAQCLVRVNLALTLEGLGDADLADGRRDRAETSWREGIAVLDEGACRTTDPESAGADTEAARAVATRLAEKLADRASSADDPQRSEDPDPASLEDLERRNEEAQEQRRRNEETREDEPDDQPDGQPDDTDPSTPPSYSW
jgi:tetratricopeptide (TPR) repeat protein